MNITCHCVQQFYAWPLETDHPGKPSFQLIRRQLDDSSVQGVASTSLCVPVSTSSLIRRTADSTSSSLPCISYSPKHWISLVKNIEPEHPDTIHSLDLDDLPIRCAPLHDLGKVGIGLLQVSSSPETSLSTQYRKHQLLSAFSIPL